MASGEADDEPMPDLSAADPTEAIAQRRLGRSAGPLRLAAVGPAAAAVAALAGQARLSLDILTPDLEPALYGQPALLEAVRRLAVARPGRLPVRVLALDAEAAIHGSLRLIELARRLGSSVQIALVPEALAERCDAFIVADGVGYCLRRRAVPSRWLADFADPAGARRLHREHEWLWAQAAPAGELRRLHL